MYYLLYTYRVSYYKIKQPSFSFVQASCMHWGWKWNRYVFFSYFFGGNIFKFIKLELFFVQEFWEFSISVVNNLKMDLNLTFRVKYLIHHSGCTIKYIKKINHFFQFKKFGVQQTVPKTFLSSVSFRIGTREKNADSLFDKNLTVILTKIIAKSINHRILLAYNNFP